MRVQRLTAFSVPKNDDFRIHTPECSFLKTLTSLLRVVGQRHRFSKSVTLIIEPSQPQLTFLYLFIFCSIKKAKQKIMPVYLG